MPAIARSVGTWTMGELSLVVGRLMAEGSLVVGRMSPQTAAEEPTTRGKRGGRLVHPRGGRYH